VEEEGRVLGELYFDDLNQDGMVICLLTQVMFVQNVAVFVYVEICGDVSVSCRFG
jgi:hypothetical protein